MHADLNGVATFHCNDMVVDGQGRAYVGNFGFDLDAEMVSRGVEAVIADHPTAKLALVTAGWRGERRGGRHALSQRPGDHA